MNAKTVRRMRLITHEPGFVTIEYPDPWSGRAITRTFLVRNRHAEGMSQYVWEKHPDGALSQPCERLGYCGNTLTATPETLATVIRREYRRMMRAWSPEDRRLMRDLLWEGLK